MSDLKSPGFFRIWFTGYLRPRRAFQLLRDSPAPLYGLYAILLRGAFIALLWMLPRAVMGLEPASLPALPFLTLENYYRHAVWLYPVFEFSHWLLLSALTHLILRLAGKTSNFDAILNIAGVGSIIIEPALRLWDWVMYFCGWNKDLVFLGFSHIILAWPWSLALMAVAYKEILGIPPRWSVTLGILTSLLFIPLAVTFLRP